jgi:hypothetical protein
VVSNLTGVVSAPPCPSPPHPPAFLTPHTGLFLPASAWKAVRRAAADQLLTLQQQHPYADGLAQGPVLPHLLPAAAAAADPASEQQTPTSVSNSRSKNAGQQQQQQATGPVLRVLCRSPGQVSAALAIPWLQEVILDFLEVHGLKEAVAAVKGAGKQVGAVACVCVWGGGGCALVAFLSGGGGVLPDKWGHGQADMVEVWSSQRCQGGCGCCQGGRQTGGCN